MANTITINFSACSPAPENGYQVKFRPVGGSTWYFVTPNPTISPIVFEDDQSGAPDGTQYEGTIRGACTDDVFGVEVPWTSSAECICVGFGETPALPDGEVGVPYSYTLPLTGTAPFFISAVTKPSWMTIAVVGSNINFTGTPDVDGTGILVQFNVTNCGLEELCTEGFIDSFDVAESGGGGTPIPGVITVSGCAEEYSITAVRESGINFAGAFPVTTGNFTPSSYPAGTYNVSVHIVSGGGATNAHLRAVDSEGNTFCQNVPGAGIFNIPGFIISDTNGWTIDLDCGDCP